MTALTDMCVRETVRAAGGRERCGIQETVIGVPVGGTCDVRGCAWHPILFDASRGKGLLDAEDLKTILRAAKDDSE